MRRYLYLSTAVAGVMMTTGAGTSLAQCVTTQDCAALGYTDSACPGSGVKCPFGNSWYCGGGAAEDCTKLGFIYGCTGTGYAGGAGQTCNGKYTSCTCSSPYTWNGTACTCPSTYKYTCSGTGYSGGSGTACGGKYTKCNCSSNYSWNGSSCALSCSSSYKYTCSGTGYSGGVGTACGGKYAACTCDSGYEWKDGSCRKQTQNGAVGDSCRKQTQNGAVGELYYCNGKVVGVRATGMGFYVALRDLGQMNWYSANSQCRNYSFCGNVKGTLPTEDQFKLLYRNKSRVNSLLWFNNGTELANGYYWVINSSGGGTRFDMSGNGEGGVGTYVRPVLASY